MFPKYLMLIISVWKVFGAFKDELLSESLRKFAIFWMTKQLFLNGFVLKWISSLGRCETTVHWSVDSTSGVASV